MNKATIGIAILICATGILGFYSCIGTKRTMNNQWASYEDWDLSNDRRIVEDEFVECYLSNNFF